MEKQLERKQSFNELLIGVVDEVLSAIGNSIKCTIYIQIKNNLDISKEQIPDKIEVFMKVLQRIFGEDGARHIELQIMKQIQSKTGVSCPFSAENSKFVACIDFIRQEYEKNI